MGLGRRLVVAGSSRALAALRRRRLGRLVALRLLRHDRLGPRDLGRHLAATTGCRRAIGVAAAGSTFAAGRAGVVGCCTALTPSYPAPPATATAASPIAIFVVIPACADTGGRTRRGPAPIVGRPVAAAALGAPLNRVSENGSGRDRERLEGAPALHPARGHPSAARALGQVGDEALRSLRPRRPSVSLRERELGVVARDEVLELLGERAAGAEDQRLERRLRDAEDRRSPCRSGPPSPGGRVLRAGVGGIRCSARTRSSIAGPSSSPRARRRSRSSSTSRGRDCCCRKRCRMRLCAIVISQFAGLRGCSPRSSARSALTNVVWVTSSASARLPRTA